MAKLPKYVPDPVPEPTIIDPVEVRNKMLVAKRIACRLYPSCASLIYAMELVETSQLPTAGADYLGHIYYNPAWADKWSKQQLAGLILHEAGHVLLRHKDRGEAINVDWRNMIDSRKWNLAGDMELNYSLERDGVPLPSDGIKATLYSLPEGLNAEQYYRMINDFNAAGLSQSHGYGTGDCGSSQGGAPRDWESKARGMSKEAVQAKLAQLADAVERAENTSGMANDTGSDNSEEGEAVTSIKEQNGKQAGQDTGNLDKLIKSVKRVHQTTWNERLRQVVARAVAPMSGRDNYSYNKLSRRRVPHVILPGMVGNKPNIVGVFDVSGSMDEKKLKAAANNMHTVASFGETWVILWGTREKDRFKVNAQTLQRKFYAGGGTNMPSGIKAALADAKLRPDVIVCITDGFSDDWDEPLPNQRNVPIIIGVIGSYQEVQEAKAFVQKECKWPQTTIVDLSD